MFQVPFCQKFIEKLWDKKKNLFIIKKYRSTWNKKNVFTTVILQIKVENILQLLGIIHSVSEILLHTG